MIFKRKKYILSEQDELLISPLSAEKLSERYGITFFRIFGFILVAIGFALLVGELYFFIVDPEMFGHLTAAKCFEAFGEVINGTISFIGMGGLLYSIAYLANQIKVEKENYIQKDMPVVFVAPRLIWELKALENDKIILKKLNVFIGALNVGDSTATGLILKINNINYKNESNELRALFKDKLPIIRTIDFLQTSNDSESEITFNSYKELVDLDILTECIYFLDGIFRNNTNKFPSLEIDLSVEFKTIRQLKFETDAKIIWSPFNCNAIKNKTQIEILQDFQRALQENKSIDKFRHIDTENPIAPQIFKLKK